MPSFSQGTQWSVINTSNQQVLASFADVADTFWSRFVGLIPRASLSSGEGLIITRCQSIHMLMMRFPIDAVFVDKADIVVGLVENISPYHFSPVYWRASYVIELPVGTIVKGKVRMGDRIDFSVQSPCT
jgi:hypothetical protein